MKGRGGIACAVGLLLFECFRCSRLVVLPPLLLLLVHDIFVDELDDQESPSVFDVS